jgi:hypothetical protein
MTDSLIKLGNEEILMKVSLRRILSN